MSFATLFHLLYFSVFVFCTNYTHQIRSFLIIPGDNCAKSPYSSMQSPAEISVIKLIINWYIRSAFDMKLSISHFLMCSSAFKTDQLLHQVAAMCTDCLILCFVQSLFIQARSAPVNRNKLFLLCFTVPVFPDSPAELPCCCHRICFKSHLALIFPPLSLGTKNTATWSGMPGPNTKDKGYYHSHHTCVIAGWWWDAAGLGPIDKVEEEDEEHSVSQELKIGVVCMATICKSRCLWIESKKISNLKFGHFYVTHIQLSLSYMFVLVGDGRCANNKSAEGETRCKLVRLWRHK